MVEQDSTTIIEGAGQEGQPGAAIPSAEDVMSKELVVVAAQEAEFIYTISKIKALGDLLTALPHKEEPYLQPPTLCTLGHIIVDQAERIEELMGLNSD